MIEHKQYVPRKPFEARKIDPTGSTAFDEYLLCIDGVPVADVNEPQFEKHFVSVDEYKEQLTKAIELNIGWAMSFAYEAGVMGNGTSDFEILRREYTSEILEAVLGE